ncbi:protein PHLOEM PROTEIN 2-LIKE A9-like [Sesamum indicum]|uniref:Protein PHLOEM PROTEIN 2-LIKE A9-like n=1 Tax=Sesamum indicum TaxID=4182 RepID=A0A6I9TLE0_SESIN|nr:protein PHLOEM PROTEIN 2-LIKE A9-like [Sesamum indicum]
MASAPIPTTNNTTPHHVGDPSITFYADGDKEAMKIPPKHLNIVWGRDNRYWKVPDDDEESSAELNQVCWLEVTGSVEGTRPNKQYQVGFHVSFTPDAFGWGGSPLYIMVKRGKDGKPVWRKLLLNPHQTKECDITATTNPHSNDPKLYFGLYELWSGKWKGGLKIHHAFIRQLP